MVPPLPPLVVNINNANKLNLTFNECLCNSPNHNCYRVFALLFRIEFEKLDEVLDNLSLSLNQDNSSNQQQQERATTTSISSSKSSTSLSLLSCSSSSAPQRPSSPPAVVYSIPTCEKIRQLATYHWRNSLTNDQKSLWKEWAALLNQWPAGDGKFKSILTFLITSGKEVSEPLQSNILEFLSQEWKILVSIFQNAIIKPPKKRIINNAIGTRTHQFGNEHVSILTQSFHSHSLSHLLKLVLFGNEYSELKQYELVHKSKSGTSLIHISSYERMCSLFTKAGVCATCQFLSPDKYDVALGCAAKVWMKCGNQDCIGYVLNETNDEIIVKTCGRSNRTIRFSRPHYDVKNGRYQIISFDVSKDNDCYHLHDYWPIRIQIMKSGIFTMTLNRIQTMEYNYDMQSLSSKGNIVIEYSNITKIKTPLW